MIEHEFFAFGGARCTIVSVRDGDRDALSAAVAETYEFESTLTRFDPTSELSRLNRSAGSRIRISPLLEAVLRAALEAYELSDGLVNAACGNAVVAAGYDRTISAVKRSPGPVSRVPAPDPLPEVLELGSGDARLRPGTLLDLGGVGKGWLADLLIDRFENGVVNIGGDVRLRGEGNEGDGWAVTLCDGTRIRVRDGAVATSGIGNRAWRGGHHVIDPRSGRPALTDLTAVSAAAPTAVHAETFAKAALLLGAGAAPGWLEAKGVDHAGMTHCVAS